MNQTTAASTPPFTAAEGWTTGTLVLIAIFAVLVVLGILYGAKLRRERRHAEKVEEKVLREAPADGERSDTAMASPPSASPVAPPPPPLDPGPPETASVPPLVAEPVAADATPEASPAIEAAGGERAAGVAAGGVAAPADGPVTQLKGLGPKVAARLAELGIIRVGQIAALTPDAADTLDARLGTFRGRMERDRWIEQARFLAAGDVKGFEAVFGKL